MPGVRAVRIHQALYLLWHLPGFLDVLRQLTVVGDVTEATFRGALAAAADAQPVAPCKSFTPGLDAHRVF